MLRHPTSQGERAHRGDLLRRFDRALGELNVFLTALAIGLALLDLTCFYGVMVGRPLTTALNAQAPQGAAWPSLAPAMPRSAADDSGR